MSDQVAQNQQMVRDLMQQGEAERKAALLQEGNTAVITVEINYTADSGKHYEGTLFMRRPSPMDYIRMGSIKAKLFAGFGVTPLVDPNTGVESMAHVDAGIKRLATALSGFQVLLVEPVPEWFKNYANTPDADLIFVVYDTFEAGLRSFRSSNESESAGNSEAGTNQKAVDGSEAVRG